MHMLPELCVYACAGPFVCAIKHTCRTRSFILGQHTISIHVNIQSVDTLCPANNDNQCREQICGNNSENFAQIVCIHYQQHHRHYRLQQQRPASFECDLHAMLCLCVGRYNDDNRVRRPFNGRQTMFSHSQQRIRIATACSMDISVG